MRLSHLVRLLTKAVRKEQEDWAWDMWISQYSRMTKDDFVSFEDFKNEVLKPQIKRSEKTSEEIMNEMLPVIKAYEMAQNKRS